MLLAAHEGGLLLLLSSSFRERRPLLFIVAQVQLISHDDFDVKVNERE
jgi:hypothetical protein